VLEFLLRLGYKMDIRKWRVSQKSIEYKKVEGRKKSIENEVRSKMGLLVDIVRPNAGATNDGNTARTALSDRYRQQFAKILQIEQWLLDDLHTLCIVLSSNLSINAELLRDFCKNLAHKYVATYPWYPMTVTLHKILIHGADIIQSCKIPIGMLSEQAAESRNKYWRRDREQHARKMSRVQTMIDLFHRALETSHPLITQLGIQERRKSKKITPLPPAAVALSKATDVGDIVYDTEFDDEQYFILNAETEGNL
jgi:hypothetical protein